MFENCTFVKNLNQRAPISLEHDANISRYGRGALYINLFKITLSGNTTIANNKYTSAIYLFSSILEIAENSTVLFLENVGYQGGAINLRGFSSIYLNDDTTVTFNGNYAWNSGGAIYHATLIDPSYLSTVN